MSRLGDFIRARLQKGRKPNGPEPEWMRDLDWNKGVTLYLYPPEPKLGPNQIRSFIDPNKIITAEPKEPVSQ